MIHPTVTKTLIKHIFSNLQVQFKTYFFFMDHAVTTSDSQYM